MRNQYRFTLILDCPDSKTYRSAFNVDAVSAPQFQPYDSCSDPRVAVIVGGVNAQGAARIDGDRKKLAEEIAAGLSEAILDAIKGQDLRDGY